MTMPIPSRDDWRLIPDAILEQDTRQNAAQQWAAQARTELAQQWGEHARAELTAIAPQGLQSAGPETESPSTPPLPSPSPSPTSPTTMSAPALPAPDAPVTAPLNRPMPSDPTAMLDRNGVINYVHQRAADFGLDPAAVLAVAAQEGLNTAPGSHWQLPGERNISFGPPSWYGNGAGAAILQQHGPNAAAWSWAPPGIDYWLGQVAQAAKGLTGGQAIHAIVHGFERPREDLAAGEIQRAQAQYANFQQPGGGPTTSGQPEVSAGMSSDTATGPRPQSFDFGNVVQQAKDAVGGAAQQAQRSFSDIVNEARQALGTLGQGQQVATDQPFSPDAGQQVLRAAGQGVQDFARGEGDIGKFSPSNILQGVENAAAPFVAPVAKAVAPYITGETPPDYLNMTDEERIADAARMAIGASTVGSGLGSEVAKAASGVAHGLTINLPKYIPDEVQQVIKDAYEANPQVMDAARRGVISDDAVRQLAEQVGQTPAQIASRWKPGQAKNAETILALREGLNSASQQVIQAQKTLQANPTSADALNAVAEALTKHAAIQEAVTGVTAEAGRALRQFRQPVTGQQFALQQIQRIAKATNMAPEELAQHLAGVDLTNPNRVANLARTLTTHNFGDKLSAIWYFNLLSSPVTHIKNTVSNALVLASRPVESLASAAVDVGVSAATRSTRQRYFGEAPAQVVGMVAGVPDAVKTTYQVLRRGVPTLPEGGKLELNTREAFKGQVSAPLRRGDILGAAQGVGGNIILAPGRALGASDAFFRTLNRSASIYADAYRMASQEGAKGRSLIDAVSQRVTNPTAEMLARADKEAAYRVFQQPSGFVDSLTQLRSKYPAVRVLLPFVQTPYNIAKYALERTPLALGKMATEATTKTGRAELAAKGTGDISDRLARVALGSATLYTLFRYAQDGNLTAAAPADPTDKDAFYRQGKQPYSMRNPVTGEWFSYAGLQPYTTIFAAAGTIADMLKGHPNEPAPDALTGMAVTALALGRATLDQPWTQGLADFLDFMSGPRVQDAEDLFNAAGKYAAGQSSMIEPAVMRWLARAQDPTIREPGKGFSGVVGTLESGIPGQSQNVPPRLTAFGRPSQRPTEGLQSLNPFASTQPTTDPIEHELARLQLKGYDVQPGFVSKQVTVGTERVPLNDQERQAYQERAGIISYELLATAMSSKEWQGLNDVGKARVIDRLVQRGHEAAAKEIGQRPEVYQRAVDSRQRRLASVP